MAPSILLLAQAAGPGGSGTSTAIFIGGIFLIMYFLMIRPQQKQQKEHRALLADLKKGDDVITQGGLMGKIYLVSDKVLTLEVANGVRVRVLKTAVQGKTSLAEEAVVVKGEEKREEK